MARTTKQVKEEEAVERPDEEFEPTDTDPAPEVFQDPDPTLVTQKTESVDTSEVSTTPAEELNVNVMETSGYQPDNVNTSVPGGFAQSSQDNLSDIRYTTPVNDQKPVTNAETNISEQLSGILSALSTENLTTLINSVLEQKYPGGIPSVTASDLSDAREVMLTQDLPQPETGLARHYRNTQHPNIRIQELDMSQVRPQGFPVQGRWIQFTNGHFVATTENQIKQLDFMSRTDAVIQGGIRQGETVGGNRDIFIASETVNIDVSKLRAAGFSEDQIAQLG